MLPEWSCSGCIFTSWKNTSAFDSAQWRPRLTTWLRLLKVGLPAGGEFALMFMFMAVMYAITRRFGADAQAGFGIGTRLMQSMFLPAMAVAFATAPIVGQNFAAGKFSRVPGGLWTCGADGGLHHGPSHLVLSARCELGDSRLHAQPHCGDGGHPILENHFVEFSGLGIRVHLFGRVPRVGQHAACRVQFGDALGEFRGAGLCGCQPNPHFELVQLWYVSVASVTLQAVCSLVLVRLELPPPGCRPLRPDLQTSQAS